MSYNHVKSVKYHFTESQYEAILCVLPLIQYQPVVTDKMKRGLTDAMAKIVHRSDTFQIHELNAIISAVELSTMVMGGKWPSMMQRVQQDAGWLPEMKKYYFVLNGLHQIFQELAKEYDLSF